jgi:hypothetical protein
VLPAQLGEDGQLVRQNYPRVPAAGHLTPLADRRDGSNYPIARFRPA